LDRERDPESGLEPIPAGNEKQDEELPSAGPFEKQKSWQSNHSPEPIFMSVLSEASEGEKEEEKEEEEGLTEGEDGTIVALEDERGEFYEILSSSDLTTALSKMSEQSSEESELAAINIATTDHIDHTSSEESELVAINISKSDHTDHTSSEESELVAMNNSEESELVAINNAKSDHADHTSAFIALTTEVSEMERLILGQLAGDPDQTTEDAIDRADIDKWRDEFRKDIRSGIEKMVSIRQQMLEQQVMQSAPEEIKNEYYSSISRIAVQRADMESKKIELEYKRLELESKKIELEAIRVDEEKKRLIPNVGNDNDRSESDEHRSQK